MTHSVLYLETGISGHQLNELIFAVKQAYYDSFSLNSSATSVVIHELESDEISDSMHNTVIVLMYTACGKGKEVKKRCAEQLNNNIRAALGAKAERIEIIIKEQANDMTGENGIMRANNVFASSAYEA